MKKSISISVKNVCSENYNAFIPTNDGGYCLRCNKNVVDFSKMNDDEIVQTLENDQGNTCGRFIKEQLNTSYKHAIPSLNSSFGWLKAGLIGIATLFVGDVVSAHLPTVPPKLPIGVSFEISKIDTFSGLEAKLKGVVLDEDNKPIPGVNISLDGTNVGTNTDINGEFIFPQELKTDDVLLFSFIGYKSQLYTVTDESPAYLEINFEFDQVLIMGDVEVNEVYSPTPVRKQNIWQKVKRVFNK